MIVKIGSIFGLVYGLSVASAAQQLADLRELTQEWVGLEQSIAKEAYAWEEKQAQLNDFIKITQIEVEQLREELTSLQAVATTADTLRLELVEKQNTLSQHEATIRMFLQDIEMKLRALKPSLPQPLQDSLAVAFQKIPQTGQSTAVGIAQRMQTVVSILSVIQQFDRKITVTQALQTLADQSRGEVTTLYIGLAAGYYVTTAGNDAGYGYPAQEGWVWESKPALAQSIIDAVAIADGIAHEAGFIDLPVVLKH